MNTAAGCRLCDANGNLPSRRVCDHRDPDGTRLSAIRWIRKRFPACLACGAPMTAGQKDTHLDCATATNTSAPTGTDSP